MGAQQPHFRVIGRITRIEIIATGRGVRDVRRLKSIYGGRRWRKMKGFAVVEMENGAIVDAEIHRYEAHGVGKVEQRLKFA